MPKNYRKLSEGIYRSASLHDLAPEDIDTIKSDGIGCVIDMRTSQEMEEKPDTVIDGIEYLHIPLFNETALGITRETGTDPGRVIRQTKDKMVLRSLIPDLRNIYRSMITDDFTRNAVITVVKTVLQNKKNGIGTLIHCTVGKDRTGITSAILLLLEGKSMDFVMKDYLVTRRYVIPEALSKAVLVLLFKQDFVAARMVYDGFIVKKEYLLEAFKEIEKMYGSIDSFLKTEFQSL